MATTKTCDKCDAQAVTVMEFKTSTTTPIVMDLCEEHLAEIKKVLRVFTGHETGEIESKLQ